MNLSIQPDMRIDRLLEQFPGTRTVFEAHGLKRLVREVTLGAVGPYLTLETALVSHGVASDRFVYLLKECCRREKNLEPLMRASCDRAAPVNVRLLLPSGLKTAVERPLREVIGGLQQRLDWPIRCTITRNLYNELSYAPYVSHRTPLDTLPDIIVATDFNPFFYRRFYERFIQSGEFIDTSATTPSPLFTRTGISDPRRQYSILGVNPLMIVADLKAIDGRPLPRCWGDLLDPIWEGSIVLRGKDHFFCHSILLPLFKEYGQTGMRRLAANVHRGRHPAHMVRTAGKGEGGALYVMPYAFARKVPACRPVHRIWPEDGALASPLMLLTKREKAALLKPITDYLTGKKMARILAGANFLSFHPQAVKPELQDLRLKWLGWDYIHANDLETINAEIDRVFLPAVHQRRRS